MPQPLTVIIAEKPSSSQKIAAALADGKIEKKGKGKAYYYEFARGGKQYAVVPAVGHLYGLREKKKSRGYPVFDVEWAPSHLSSKHSAFTKAYLDNIVSLSKKASDYYAACDYDIEGEVIGANVLEFACRAKNARRMKFSTLTQEELQESFENASPTLDKKLVEAGRTRHLLDFFWGISLSRALMSAIKSAGRFQIMSVGRVQGPALAVICKREKEISLFVPVPYWQVFAEIKETIFEHSHGRFDSEAEAKSALSSSKKNGEITSVKASTYNQLPPFPFDLTTLQTEAYRNFGFTPTETLQVAQKLYEQAVISYPRTSSQQLSEKLGLPAIIKKLSSQPALKKFCDELAALKRFTPHNGKQSDPAHPAIYPTGVVPQGLSSFEQKLYDLVAKRFLACFAKPAVRERMAVGARLGTQDYSASGVRTLEKNWFSFYEPYVKLEETVMPPFSQGEKIIASRIWDERKETQPPKRFTQASIVRKLEENGLGTKCIAGFEEVTALTDSHKINVPIAALVDRLRDKDKVHYIYTAGSDRVITEKITGVCSREFDQTEKMLKVETDYFSLCTTDLHDYFTYDGAAIKTKKANALKINDRIVAKRLIESSPKSKLLAHLIGDGSLSIRKDVKNAFDIRYHNKDILLIEEFKRCVREVYGVTVATSNSSRGRFYVRLPLPLGTKIVKEFPEIANKNVRFEEIDSPASFASALIDDEGCIFRLPIKKIRIKGVDTFSHGIPKIKVTMKTIQSLQTLHKCLAQIGILSKINNNRIRYKGRPYDCFTLWIMGRRNLEKCANQLPFGSIKKLSRLIAGLGQYSVIRRKARALSRVGNGWMRLSDLSELGTLGNRTLLANELSEDGIISMRKRTIRSGAKNNNTTVIEIKLVRSFSDTVYSHLDDEVISFDLFAKKITSITDVPYAGSVFDLTISPENPRYFVGKGNFLVHNSTRAGIVQTLFDRGYVSGKSIEATPLGMSVFGALQKNAPQILEEKLTRHFEEEIDAITAGKTNSLQIIEEGKKTLSELLDDFRKKEKAVGEELLKSLDETRREQSTLGACKACGKGNLVIRSSRFGVFVGCSAYPACRQTFPLPRDCKPVAAGKECEKCGTPIVTIVRRGKRPFRMCLSTTCVTKANWGKKNGERQGEENNEEKKEEKNEDGKQGVKNEA